jgi:hypothetical protein
MVLTGAVADSQTRQAIAMTYAGSKQSPQRLAALYKQLKGALVDAGLAKE